MKVDGHVTRMEKFGTRKEKKTHYALHKTHYNVMVLIKIDFYTRWKSVDRTRVAHDEAICENGKDCGEFFSLADRLASK